MKISFIGTGNVATALAQKFKEKNFSVLQVTSAHEASAKAFAEKFHAQAIAEISALQEADFLFICVPDKIIAPIVKQIPLKNTVVAHTSGSISIDVFKDAPFPAGVLYPLQTIRKKNLNPQLTIPFCVEGKNELAAQKLFQLAKNISPIVQKLSSEERKMLHLSAVFANNFTNLMLDIAYQILDNKKEYTELLQPLIQQTFSQIIQQHPHQLQTGPAKRKDILVIEEHLHLLKKKHPDWAKLYNLVSEIIMHQHE